MSDAHTPKFGTIGWQDLTVPNAVEVRDFYQGVVGWEARGEEMGGYEDFHMMPAGTGQSVAGICHARGMNADLPPQWLIYIVVADIQQSAARCRELGGEVVVAPQEMGGGSICVIRDPAEAVCALYQYVT